MKNKVQELLNLAGIKINGTNPWDIQVHNEKFYARVLSGGILALGESYMDGWWDCKELDVFFDKVISARLDKKVRMSFALTVLKSKVINLQSKKTLKDSIHRHYDIGNELYTNMLDKNMQYTCGYWKNAKNLDQAQINKLKLICEKLHLKPGMSVLELGGGFGGLARFIAKEYKCTVVSYNISKEQIKYGREICKGLPVTFMEQDYREAKGTYDRVVSVGMCEHVGYKNYRSFMELIDRCLKDDGLCLVHTIGGNVSVHANDEWTEKYTFPNSMLPSAKQLTVAYEGILVMEDWHNFSSDYDPTLMGWYNNFVKNWPKIKHLYDDRFYRMWSFYLLMCAGSFRSRKNQLWQIVFSKNGVRGGYKSVR